MKGRTLMPGTKLDAAVTRPGEDFSRVALSPEVEGKRFLIRSTLMDWPVQVEAG